jgi:hypothetical protein
MDRPLPVVGQIPVIKQAWWLLGKTYRASENAFTGSAHYMRYQMAKKYFSVAEKAGIDLNNKTQLQGIGTLVNSLTARGGDRKIKPGIINNVIWSPGMMRAHLDVLTAHIFDTKATPFARRQAAINLVQTIAGITGILAISKAFDNDSVDWDLKGASADIGTIRIGDTRFDVTGGMRGIGILALRLGKLAYSYAPGAKPLEIKSSSSGKMVKYNTGKFGAPTALDTVETFLEGKAAPFAAEIITFLRGQDWSGNKPGLAQSGVNLFTPLPATTATELWNNPKAAPFLLAMLADMIGISTNTYSPKKTKKEFVPK